MVRGYVPTGVPALVITVSVDVFAVASVMLTDEGLKLCVAPVGSPVMLKATCPVNPLEGVSVRL